MATANTTSAAAKASAPSAGGAVCTLDVNPGLYQVDVYVELSGTAVVAADVVNMELQSDSEVAGTLVTVGAVLAPGSIGLAYSQAPTKISFPQVLALSEIQVSAVANATSATVYYAGIVATPINQPTDEPPFFNTSESV
jgi:hypothetical protein